MIHALMIPALLIVAALTHSAVDWFTVWFGGTKAAWAYVMYGAEATALWLALCAYIDSRQYHALIRWSGLAMCAYGVFESSQRWACRLMLPMDKAPSVPSVCEAAGIHTVMFTPVALALVAWVVALSSNR